MKKFLVLFLLIASLGFAQVEGEPEFTNNEILLLRAARPLYREKLKLAKQLEEQAEKPARIAALESKIAQVTNIRNTWESQGKTKAVKVADLVLDVLSSDLAIAQAALIFDPADHSVRISEINSILLETLDLLLTIAPEGRTKASYLEYVQ